MTETAWVTIASTNLLLLVIGGLFLVLFAVVSWLEARELRREKDQERDDEQG